jgi:hypothetical protein
MAIVSLGKPWPVERIYRQISEPSAPGYEARASKRAAEKD